MYRCNLFEPRLKAGVFGMQKNRQISVEICRYLVEMNHCRFFSRRDSDLIYDSNSNMERN